jgi:hypothetical protein
MTERFTLLSELGRGCMGVVRKARDDKTGPDRGASFCATRMPRTKTSAAVRCLPDPSQHFRTIGKRLASCWSGGIVGAPKYQ